MSESDRESGSRLYDDLHNPGIDKVVALETAELRLERDVAYDIAKEEMRKNMRHEIEQESRQGRAHLRSV